jgi:hypothetical protein
MSTDKHPVALIRIVDSAGKPVAGAVIRPDGLRTKAGPYVSGHYGWRMVPNGVANDPVVTDGNGYARVPYPKHVFERIETGQISFSVSHAEFVPDRPFREVTTTPPAGAMAGVGRLPVEPDQRKPPARLDPVVLQGILKLSVRVPQPEDDLFSRRPPVWHPETNFWIRPVG